MSENKMTFEEAFQSLEKTARDIMDSDVPLEKAIESYRDGIKYYGICSGILNEARQLIQLYDRQSDSLKNFSEGQE